MNLLDDRQLFSRLEIYNSRISWHLFLLLRCLILFYFWTWRLVDVFLVAFNIHSGFFIFCHLDYNMSQINSSLLLSFKFKTPCVRVLISFFELMKYLAVISLNRLFMPLVSVSAPSFLWFLDLIFWLYDYIAGFLDIVLMHCPRY